MFDWVEGTGLNPREHFPPSQKYTNPNSPFKQFKDLSVELRLSAYRRILDFHEFVEDSGYVAVDFYDGSIVYDFDRAALTICDVDHYRPKPYENRMGRMWGSSRFMSPEEFELGAPIDERTIVYCMGATAFCLLGSDRDRAARWWDADERLFRIATKAVAEEPSLRFQSVSRYNDEWKSAVEK